MAQGVDAGAAASVPVYLNQDFRVLWLSRTLGQTAANTVRFGSLIIVTQNTGSGWYASLLILAWMVPAVLGGLLSGVVVDVFAKRWILTVTNAVRAGVCLAFLATAQGTPEVYALVGLLAFLGPFIGPAESALVPTLVGRHELTSANAFLNFMRYVAQAAGFALLAPLLMETLSTEAMIIVTAVLFAGAAIFAALIPVRRLGHDPHPSSPMNRPAGAAAVCARPCASSKRNPLSSAPPCISLARRDHAPPHGPLAVLPHRRLGPEGERPADRPGAGDRWDAAGPAPGLPLCPPSRRGLARDGRAAGVRRGAALAGLHRWPGCRPRPGDDRRPGRSRPPARPLLHLAVGHDRRFAHGLAFSLVTVAADAVLNARVPPSMQGRVFSLQMLIATLASLPPLLAGGALVEVVDVRVVLGLVPLLLAWAWLYARWGTADPREWLRPRRGGSVPP